MFIKCAKNKTYKLAKLPFVQKFRITTESGSMIYQGGSTIKARIELPITSRQHCDMT